MTRSDSLLCGLSLVLTLSLAACGGSSRTSSTASSASPASSASTALAHATPTSGAGAVMLELQPELATYRAAHGKPWRHGGEQEAAMKIAPHLFASLPLVGASRETVLGWLGPATQVQPANAPDHERWVYIRGTGEIASIYTVDLASGVVTSIAEVPSQ